MQRRRKAKVGVRPERGREAREKARGKLSAALRKGRAGLSHQPGKPCFGGGGKSGPEGGKGRRVLPGREGAP